MRYAFFGTPEFAAIILEKLIKAGLTPALVVCNPDRPAGRKKIITPPPTKVLAEKYGITVWQPEGLKIENWKLEIDKLGNIDLCVVAAYSKIIPKSVLDTAPHKFVGVHPSLLPKYRGATPIQSVILNGEEITGVTLFLMDEQVDHGPILAQREFSIFNFQFSTLQQKLAELVGDMLVETLPKFTKGEYTLKPQNDKEATYTKKFKDDDAYVDLAALQAAMRAEPRPFGREKAVEIERKVRALNPEPGVWTFQNNKRMKILEAELIDGKLKLKKIQFEGKKPFNVA